MICCLNAAAGKYLPAPAPELGWSTRRMFSAGILKRAWRVVVRSARRRSWAGGGWVGEEDVGGGGVEGGWGGGGGGRGGGGWGGGGGGLVEVADQADGNALGVDRGDAARGEGGGLLVPAVADLDLAVAGAVA